jgi:hypothetical protein
MQATEWISDGLGTVAATVERLVDFEASKGHTVINPGVSQALDESECGHHACRAWGPLLRTPLLCTGKRQGNALVRGGGSIALKAVAPAMGGESSRVVADRS